MMEEWRLQHTAEMASAFERHNAALRDAEACRLQLEAQIRATAAAEAVAEQRRMLCGALREAAAMAAEDAWGDACRQRDAMQRDHVSSAYACVCVWCLGWVDWLLVAWCCCCWCCCCCCW
jgi:hypothetical protein